MEPYSTTLMHKQMEGKLHQNHVHSHNEDISNLVAEVLKLLYPNVNTTSAVRQPSISTPNQPSTTWFMMLVIPANKPISKHPEPRVPVETGLKQPCDAAYSAFLNCVERVLEARKDKGRLVDKADLV